MKNSGISLITVVIMVVIMIILATIAMSNGMDTVKEATDTKVAVEITELKKAVADRMIEIERNPTLGMPGLKVDNIVNYVYYIDSMETAELQEFIRSVDAENVEYFRLVDSIAAAALGVSSVQEEHYFIVDYYSGKVYGTVNMAAYRLDNPVT